MTQAHLVLTGQARRKDRSTEEIAAVFRGHEVADVLCHVFILAHHHKIDVVDRVPQEVAGVLTHL